MRSDEFAKRIKEAATKHKTLYVLGCFGAPLNERNKARYTKNQTYNKSAERTSMIMKASEDTFGFDCVCLIKGILWGWNADQNKVYGGAIYASNGVPDLGADDFFDTCSEVSSDFSKIEPGEAVWLPEHIGIYIGDGLAVECTPKWENKVQITACNKTKLGYHRRNWKKHGKLPYVEYPEEKIKIGDLVKITGTKYYSGKKIPEWVKAKNWYVRSIKKDRVVIDLSEDGKSKICSPVRESDLSLVLR